MTVKTIKKTTPNNIIKEKKKLRELQLKARKNLAKEIEKVRKETRDGLNEIKQRQMNLTTANIKYERTIKEIKDTIVKNHKNKIKHIKKVKNTKKNK